MLAHSFVVPLWVQGPVPASATLAATEPHPPITLIKNAVSSGHVRFLESNYMARRGASLRQGSSVSNYSENVLCSSDNAALAPASPYTISVPAHPAYRWSPFKQLDVFVSRNCCMGGVQGQLRAWTITAGTSHALGTGSASGLDDCSPSSYDATGKRESNETAIDIHKSCTPPLPVLRITYQILKNKWCGNIGRAHTSNHIMLEVDLSRGWLYQRCWDPECKGYRSPGIAVPTDYLPSEAELNDMYIEHCIVKDMQSNPVAWP